jgi:hypothetical protein
MFDLKFYLVLCKIYKQFISAFHDWKEMKKLSIKFNLCHGNKHQQLAEMMNSDEMLMLYFHRVCVYFDIVRVQSCT